MSRLRMATIYAHPRDYPDHFVVRECEVTEAGVIPNQVCSLHETLTKARDEASRDGRVCIPRHPTDDPVIVEVWV